MRAEADRFPLAPDPPPPPAGRVKGRARGRGAALALAAGVSALSLAFAAAGPARADCADVALVLAIDASGSVMPDEFALQQAGYVQAFRSPRVHAAIAAAGTVAVAVMLWGDSEFELQTLPMARLAGAAEALRLAARIEAMPRRVSGNTGIGRAVAAAVEMLAAPEACAIRRIINVSGDGVEVRAPRPRRHVPLTEARARAEAAGITINGLAILNEEPALDAWYRDRLITGPGAFVMAVEDYGTFAAAIEEKLLREIAPAALSDLAPAAAAPPHRRAR